MAYFGGYHYTPIERQGGKDRAVQDRRAALKSELDAKEEKLKRLYRALEDGLVNLDVHLKERIQTLKAERDIAQASLERIAVQLNTRATITPAHLEAFARLMRDKLETGDIQARRAYLRSVIWQIEIDDDKVTILGDKATLAAVIAGRQTQATNVRGFVRNWRARRDSNS
jgi:site-specific DNA recombinase